jgi:hypothetical protein
MARRRPSHHEAVLRRLATQNLDLPRLSGSPSLSVQRKSHRALGW